MYSLAVKSSQDYLKLTDNPNYIVAKVTGLTAAGNAINTAAVSGVDGEHLNSTRLNKRNIVITILPNDPVDENRNRLYRLFPEKGIVRLYYENRLRDVYIDGVVETLDGDLFSMREEIQISILCPDPYFVKNTENGTKVSFSPIVPLLEFPYSPPEEGMSMSEIMEQDIEINNEGTVAAGASIHFTIRERMEYVRIQNRKTGEYIGIEYPLKPYDNIYINTTKGEKGIHLIRDGVEQNLINYRLKGSSWLQIDSGNNTWWISADRNTYQVDIKWKELYEGV